MGEVCHHVPITQKKTGHGKIYDEEYTMRGTASPVYAAPG